MKHTDVNEKPNMFDNRAHTMQSRPDGRAMNALDKAKMPVQKAKNILVRRLTDAEAKSRERERRRIGAPRVQRRVIELDRSDRHCHAARADEVRRRKHKRTTMTIRVELHYLAEIH